VLFYRCRRRHRQKRKGDTEWRSERQVSIAHRQSLLRQRQLWLSLRESQKVVSASRLRGRHQTHQEGSELTSGRVVESLQSRRRHQQNIHVSRLC